MLNILASKFGEAQAFADGLISPLNALSMDRIRDEEESKETERSRQSQYLRYSRTAAAEAGGGVMDELVFDSAPAHSRERPPFLAAAPTPPGSPVEELTEGDRTSIRSSSSSITTCQVRKNRQGNEGADNTANMGELGLHQDRDSQRDMDFLTPNDLWMVKNDHRGGATKDKRSTFRVGRAQSSSLLLARGDDEEEDGNFEDEFDPILASIRKSPQQAAASSTASFASSPGGASPKRQESSPTNGRENNGNNYTKIHSSRDVTEAVGYKQPNVGVSFAAGLLPIFPGKMLARAGDVVAQSTAHMSKTAEAVRAAVESGINSANNHGKRRPRGYDEEEGQGIEMEEDRSGGAGGSGGAASSSRRSVVGLGRGGGGGMGGKDDVRVMNVDDLLSQEERNQLAALSGGRAGGGEWRRFRKYIPIVVGVALLGLVYLWRWKALPEDVAGVAGEAGDAEGSALVAGRF